MTKDKPGCELSKNRASGRFCANTHKNLSLPPTFCLSLRRHDTQHNDTQHNDIRHNDTQYNIDLRLCWVFHYIYYYAECHNGECRFAECRGAPTLLTYQISWVSFFLSQSFLFTFAQSGNRTHHLFSCFHLFSVTLPLRHNGSSSFIKFIFLMSQPELSMFAISLFFFSLSFLFLSSFFFSLY